MENRDSYNPFERRPIVKSTSPAVKWVKEWVPQDVVSTGGKCYLLKWVREDSLKKLREGEIEPEVPEPEPEPTTEVLFLCNYEGCGKTFVDAGALKKHSHIHEEKQYICHYEGCGKKFVDSSQLKRHFHIHTVEKSFISPHEGCGEAKSALDFNLKYLMKCHSQENYHICPYPGCGERYAHEYTLKNHIAVYHEKNMAMETPKFVAPLDRPYACPYEGCEKAYIYEYKLKLHLRKEHPGHLSEDNPERFTPVNANYNHVEHDMDEGSDQDAYGKHLNGENPSRTQKKQSRGMRDLRMPPAMISRNVSSSSAPAVAVANNMPWPVKEEFGEEEDSEETEEDCDNVVDIRWRYRENSDSDDADDEETEDQDDDEETEDED